MATRNIYLKIEQVLDYSPVEPDMMAAPPKQYRRDCMRNPGHEDTTIPLSEVNVRMLAALVYREYLDKDYLIPKPDKLVWPTLMSAPRGMLLMTLARQVPYFFLHHQLHQGKTGLAQ